MENLIMFLATTIVLRISSSSRATMKKFLIGDTGCSVYTFSGENDFDTTMTLTGDRMYLHDYTENGVTYGVICIHMKEQYAVDEAEELLKKYMGKLKGSLFVLHDTGIMDAHDYNSISTISLENYWQDVEGIDWKVKGYTNGKVLSVLYVKNISQAEIKKQEFFLDSFHFKASL